MSPLTPRQVELVQTSWAQIGKDYKTNGAELFTSLFRAYPADQQKFAHLKGIKIEDVARSQEMRSHGSVVLHSISSIVDTLDDWGFATRVINQRAEDHRPRGVGMEQFSRLLNEMFPKLLKQKLGAKYDGETQLAWSAATGAILSVMETALQKTEGA